MGLLEFVIAAHTSKKVSESVDFPYMQNNAKQRETVAAELEST